LCGAPPGRPPHEQGFFKGIISSGLIWDEIEKAGIPGIQGVWRNTRFWVVVSIKQKYPGHAKQAVLIASQCHAGAYMGRYVIVVDEDIDPTNIDDVLWALMSRSDPATSIDIIKGCWSGPLDPIIPPGQKGLNSRAVIDACKPFLWIDKFPATVEPSRELRDKVLRKWGSIIISLHNEES
jgi:4-hydroxy-3-polyprenylbenzoate decarboxylase